MNVLVTGGAGYIGKVVAEQLLVLGHEVRVVDSLREANVPGRGEKEAPYGAEMMQMDITDFQAVRKAVEGQDAVLHLAAIPYPGGAPSEQLFDINCRGTYNVFEAAAQTGIRRVVCASSINALGFNFGVRPFAIQYLPIDEDHPTFTTDPYSFSKQVVEEIARYYWRRDRISSVCLRLPMVYSPGGWLRGLMDKFQPMFLEEWNRLLGLDPDERRAVVGGWIQALDEDRGLRLREKPFVPVPGARPWWEMEGEPAWGRILALIGYTDFWTVISVVDAARSFIAGLQADFEGSHPLYVNEPENSMGLDARLLAEVFFPGAQVRVGALRKNSSLVSCRRAQDLIGFTTTDCFREQ